MEKEIPLPTRHLRKNLSEIILQSEANNSILYAKIDHDVNVLIVPKSMNYSQRELQEIVKNIQLDLLPQQNQNKQFFAIEWSNIQPFFYPFTPTIGSWYLNFPYLTNRQAELFFFVNTDNCKTVFENIYNKKIKNTSLLAFNFKHWLNSPSHILELLTSSIVHVESVGSFFEEYLTYLASLAPQLQKVYEIIKATFPNFSFHFRKNELFFRLSGQMEKIPLLEIAEILEGHSCTLSQFFSYAQPEDLCLHPETIRLHLRSPTYLKVYPFALAQEKEKSALISIEKEKSQGIEPFFNKKRAGKERFFFYEPFGQKNLRRKNFELKVISLGKKDYFLCALLGKKATTIALSPYLVAALLDKLEQPSRKEIAATAKSENILLLHDPQAPQNEIEILLQRATFLYNSLEPEGSDRLDFFRTFSLPSFGYGNFSLNSIPLVFFDLIETAKTSSNEILPYRKFYLQGLAFEIIREWEQAISFFQQSYRQNPSDTDVCFALGRALTESGKGTEGIFFLQKALTCYPEDPEILNTLGRAHLLDNSPLYAIGVLEQAVKKVPDDSFYLANLGRAYFDLKRFSQSHEVLQRAIALSPDCAPAHNVLAQIFWRNGDIKNAIFHARKAFASDPCNKSMQELLWALSISPK